MIIMRWIEDVSTACYSPYTTKTRGPIRRKPSVRSQYLRLCLLLDRDFLCLRLRARFLDPAFVFGVGFRAQARRLRLSGDVLNLGNALLLRNRDFGLAREVRQLVLRLRGHQCLPRNRLRQFLVKDLERLDADVRDIDAVPWYSMWISNSTEDNFRDEQPALV